MVLAKQHEHCFNLGWNLSCRLLQSDLCSRRGSDHFDSLKLQKKKAAATKNFMEWMIRYCQSWSGTAAATPIAWSGSSALFSLERMIRCCTPGSGTTAATPWCLKRVIRSVFFGADDPLLHTLKRNNRCHCLIAWSGSSANFFLERVIRFSITFQLKNITTKNTKT